MSGCTPTIDSIQKTIFSPRCATAGCHTGTDAQGDLDLGAPGVESRLVGAASSQCGGQTLVVAGNPSGSYLIAKVDGSKPKCGRAMPLDGTHLDPSDIACIRKRIEGVAPGLVGVPSSACSSKTRVVAGDAGASYLMSKLTGVGMCTGSQMPKRGVTLPAAELDLVRSWRCNGAAND